MRGISNEKGSAALKVIFFANIFMLAVLCALVTVNDSVGKTFDNAGQAISDRQAR